MISQMLLGNVRMNGYLIVVKIVAFSVGWGRHFCQCFSMDLQSIPDLTKRMPQQRHSFQMWVWKFTPLYTFSTKGSALMCTSRPGLTFKVVANQVFCQSYGYIPPVFRVGQQWTYRNAAQIPAFMKFLCIRTHTQSGQDRPKSCSCKPCSINSEMFGIGWVMPNNCTSCPAGGNQSTTPLVAEYEY
jgi:hypothetical protein